MHKLECIKEIAYTEGDELFGKVTVLYGSMRCPDEDGGGGSDYQENVVALMNGRRKNPSNKSLGLKDSNACHEQIKAMNVHGFFDPLDFSVAKCQAAVQAALQSKISSREGSKQVGMPQGASPLASLGGGRIMLDMVPLEPGQRRHRSMYQDSRLSH